MNTRSNLLVSERDEEFKNRISGRRRGRSNNRRENGRSRERHWSRHLTGNGRSRERRSTGSIANHAISEVIGITRIADVDSKRSAGVGTTSQIRKLRNDSRTSRQSTESDSISRGFSADDSIDELGKLDALDRVIDRGSNLTSDVSVKFAKFVYTIVV